MFNEIKRFMYSVIKQARFIQNLQILDKTQDCFRERSLSLDYGRLKYLDVSEEFSLY